MANWGERETYSINRTVRILIVFTALVAITMTVFCAKCTQKVVAASEVYGWRPEECDDFR